MNWKGTAALVVAAVGLGAYVYFVESKKDAPPPADSTEVKLWSLKDDLAIKHLTFEDDKGTKAEYVRAADGWHYAPRASASLESFNWDGPFGYLKDMTADRKVAESLKDPKEFGLDHPTMKISFGDATHPDQYRVTVGGKHPIDASYFFQTQQDRGVYLIGSYKLEAWQRLVTNPPVATPSPSPSPLALPSHPPAPAASASHRP